MKCSFKNQKRGGKCKLNSRIQTTTKSALSWGFWLRKSFKTYNFWPRPACLSAKGEERGQLSPQAMSSSSAPRSDPAGRQAVEA